MPRRPPSITDTSGYYGPFKPTWVRYAKSGRFKITLQKTAAEFRGEHFQVTGISPNFYVTQKGTYCYMLTVPADVVREHLRGLLDDSAASSRMHAENVPSFG